ncbi:hypothetical protein [Maridesulfovibrio sp.]|uniref:hypothetical protein n=1 Tax=Maridesulfovibrio sp. TaxID=2795000 RepID=UPI002A18A8DF|nr:hypothetical protein [Maridesulfovibrio sp.]
MLTKIYRYIKQIEAAPVKLEQILFWALIPPLLIETSLRLNLISISNTIVDSIGMENVILFFVIPYLLHGFCRFLKELLKQYKLGHLIRCNNFFIIELYNYAILSCATVSGFMLYVPIRLLFEEGWSASVVARLLVSLIFFGILYFCDYSLKLAFKNKLPISIFCYTKCIAIVCKGNITLFKKFKPIIPLLSFGNIGLIYVLIKLQDYLKLNI